MRGKHATDNKTAGVTILATAALLLCGSSLTAGRTVSSKNRSINPVILKGLQRLKQINLKDRNYALPKGRIINPDQLGAADFDVLLDLACHKQSSDYVQDMFIRRQLLETAYGIKGAKPKLRQLLAAYKSAPRTLEWKISNKAAQKIAQLRRDVDLANHLLWCAQRDVLTDEYVRIPIAKLTPPQRHMLFDRGCEYVRKLYTSNRALWEKYKDLDSDPAHGGTGKPFEMCTEQQRLRAIKIAIKTWKKYTPAQRRKAARLLEQRKQQLTETKRRLARFEFEMGRRYNQRNAPKLAYNQCIWRFKSILLELILKHHREQALRFFASEMKRLAYSNNGEYFIFHMVLWRMSDDPDMTQRRKAFEFFAKLQRALTYRMSSDEQREWTKVRLFLLTPDPNLQQPDQREIICMLERRDSLEKLIQQLAREAFNPVKLKR